MNTAKVIVHYIQDFFVGILPIRRSKQKMYGYAFLIHSRNRNDIYRKYRFFKLFPKSWVDFFTLHSWPITVSQITGLISQKTGKEVPGWIIGIPMTAHQMMEHREKALQKIIQAARLARKKGAKIIGLGALTSSLSKGGLDLLDKVDVNITTGHAYTAYTVTGNLFALAELMNIDQDKAVVAIVGAAGSVGSTSAKIIARKGFKNIILIDLERKKHFFADLMVEMRELNTNVEIETSHQVQDVKKADFIITATNAPEALIKSEDLKSGAIIIDDAQPSDVSEEVLNREDVLVVEAGVVRTPSIRNNFNMGLKDRFDNFCCMAELLILAAEEWREHYVINRATLDLVDEVSELGKKHNFRLGDYQNFKEVISKQKLATIKNIIQSAYGHN